MRIISRRTLREFWEKYSDAERPLQAWYTNVKRANWKTPSDAKDAYQNVSFVENNRVIFNIKGNTYRLIGNKLSVRYYLHPIYWDAPRI